MNPSKINGEELNKDTDFRKYPREVLNRMFETDEIEHKKFIKELFERYNELEESKDKKYTQDWHSYNEAQSKEKIFLMNILDELLNYIEFPIVKKVGRNPIPIRDKIFYLIIQAYNQKSSRRCTFDSSV